MSENSDNTPDGDNSGPSAAIVAQDGGSFSIDDLVAKPNSVVAHIMSPHAGVVPQEGLVLHAVRFPKTWRSELYGLLVFAVLIVKGITLSSYFPGSVMSGPLISLGSYEIWLSLPLFWLLPAFWLGMLIVRIYNVRYSADERGLEAITGILSFSQKITRVRYEDVRSLELDQTLLERILDVGELEVGTAGTAGVEMAFEGVGAPFSIKKLIQFRRKQEESAENIMPRSETLAP